MRPVTDRFLTTLRGSHRMVSRARVVTPGQFGVNPGPLNADGTPVNEIPIITGDVKHDATADIRATLDMTTSYRWPANERALLAPYGNEVFIERGLVYGDGVREWVSQGYFRMYSVDQDDAPNGAIRIAAKDRMSGLIDARILAPFEFSLDTAVSTIFENLVGEVYPGAPIVYDFDAAGTSFSTSHVIEQDRYKFLKDICDSLGKVMYFDYAGRLQVRTAPDPTKPVFDVNHGKGGVVVSVSRSLDRAAVYNGWVVTGEQPGESPPVRAVSLDLNPNSPTFWDGPYGKVPRFYSSTFITTVEQAQAAADAFRDRRIGLPYSIDFTMVPNCALEVLDPVQLSYTDKVAPEIHVIETVTVGLEPGAAMPGTTRKQADVDGDS